MRNPNKPIKDMDDRPRSRDEIAVMIDNMFKVDEDGNTETVKRDKETA